MPPAIVTDRVEAGSLAAAERVCSEAFGLPVAVRVVDEIVVDPAHRHTVHRLAVIGEDPGVPGTVVVKQSNRGPGHISREWAALLLLTESGQADGIAPRLYGGDAEQDLLVMEDLGDLRERQLRDVLLGNDAEAARAALVGTAAAFGALHAATTGRNDDYKQRLASLPAAAPLDFHQSGRVEAAAAAIMRPFDLLAIATPAQLPDEIAAITTELVDPGPFLALVHGDPCPSNVALAGSAPRLYDFEVSGFRHALLDGSMGRLRHLNCLDAFRIPADTAADMDAAYRVALSRRCPAALDDDRFARGMVAACAAWTAVLLEHLPRVLDEDRPRGPASYRQRILAALQAFSETAEAFDRYPALRLAFVTMLDRLRCLWPDQAERIPVFPALRSGQ